MLKGKLLRRVAPLSLLLIGLDIHGVAAESFTQTSRVDNVEIIKTVELPSRLALEVNIAWQLELLLEEITLQNQVKINHISYDDHAQYQVRINRNQANVMPKPVDS